ncbi:putative Acyltransferase 3 [Nitrospira japonica]|uniref:Putative Acyltransferase 3 n=1 Tax=Nitrospira japonica TaxID=1325564 RepID=A0A1W1IAW1_9BACT|nr:acyltransferase [Nitrospira japonica]SLM50187.1 putative Acyltransferase 3 [Nitrospira japonica]
MTIHSTSQKQADDSSSIFNSSYLPGLDGLRAVAILTVIVYHFGFGQVPGDLGVELFFVLSGFLITRQLLREFRQSGAVDLGRFHHRRLLRIFPAYYVYLAFAFIEECARGYCWTPGLLASGIGHVVNYYNAFNGHPNTVIAHAWALSLQEQFYILWPLALIVLVRRGGRWVIAGLTAGIFVVVLWRCALIGTIGIVPAYLYNALDTRFDSLALGCVLAALTEFPEAAVRVQALSKWPLMPVGTLAILLMSRLYGSDSYHYSIGFTVDTFLLTLFVMQIVLQHGHWMWTWLDHPVSRYVGKVSYSLYLWHLIGFGVANRMTQFQPVLQLVVALLVGMGLASASYWLIERPFLKIREKNQ